MRRAALRTASPTTATATFRSICAARSRSRWAIRARCWRSRWSASPIPASGFNNCHRHFPELLEAVKRGVLAAGALPVEFPTISLGEVFLNPTSLKYRNLMSIDTEEMIRAQPMDAVVLMGGCDKTVPAQLMGAVSAGVPAIMLVAGPMMTGRHRGERLGACTDCRRFWARYRAGDVDAAEIDAGRGPARRHRRHLRGDGHGLDHGLHRRGARHDRCPAPRRSRPCMPTGCAPPRRPARAAVRLIGSQAHARPDRQREVGRECAARAAGARRLDQRDHPSDRDRRPRRRDGHARRSSTSCPTRRRCWST